MKTSKLIVVSFVCAFLSFNSIFVFADTSVLGPIVGDVTWSTGGARIFRC